MNPALISAGASLLGGLLGRPKNVSAAKNRYDDVAGIFKAAEEFKFSPFALLGSPAVGPSVVQNTMGSAIADAGLLLADGMSKQKMKALEEERLRLENEKLRGEVNRMMLRPKVPVGKATIGKNNDPRKKQPQDPVLPEDPAANPLPDTLPIDPRREVQNDPIRTHAGFIVTDSPIFGRIYTATLDGEEPAGGEWFGMATAVPQIINNKGHNLSFGGGRESRPNMTRKQGLERQRELRTRWDKLAELRRLKKKTKNADARQRHQELMAPFLRRQ